MEELTITRQLVQATSMALHRIQERVIKEPIGVCIIIIGYYLCIGRTVTIK